MGGCVPIMQHAFRVFWTLLFCVCWTWDSGDATVQVAGVRHGYGQDSIRSLRLKLLALELGSGVQPRKVHGTPHFFSETDTDVPEASWRFLKSLDSDSATSQDHTQKRFDLGMDGNEIITPERRELQMTLLKRLYRDVTGMDNVHQEYTRFHGHLKSFVDELATRFLSLPGSPPQLQYVKDIPSILPTDDDDFVNGEVEKIVVKCRFVLDITKEVLERSSAFLNAQDKQWLDGAKLMINYYASYVGVSLLSLSFSDDGTNKGISILPDGISGINTGVQNGISYQTLQNLNSLVETLELGSVSQTN